MHGFLIVYLCQEIQTFQKIIESRTWIDSCQSIQSISLSSCMNLKLDHTYGLASLFHLYRIIFDNIIMNLFNHSFFLLLLCNQYIFNIFTVPLFRKGETEWLPEAFD